MNHHSVWDIKVEVFHAYNSNRDKILEQIVGSHLKFSTICLLYYKIGSGSNLGKSWEQHGK